MNKIYYSFIVLILSLLGRQHLSYGQGASCATAASIPLTSTCSFAAYTVSGGTAQTASCGTPTQAGWYSFLSPADGTVTVQATTNQNLVLSSYTNVCGALTQLNCANAAGVGGTETLTFSVASGVTYWVQVGSIAGAMTGNICATFSPVNNACSAATVLTPGAAGAACSNASGSTTGATSSIFGAACGGTTADDDVWYRFTATATSHTVNVAAGTMTDPVIEWFDTGVLGLCPTLGGGNCVNASATNETVTIPTTVGNIYYVRVYSAGNATGQGTFLICITTPANNDNCTNAITLTPSAVGATCSATGGTTVGTTASAFAAACGGTTADDDVWYRFTATSTSHTVDVVAGSMTNPVIEWYAAASCPAAAGTCANTGTTNETVTFTTTVGTMYYVRVYSAGNGTGQGTFTICVSTPPANDNCANAVTLTPAAVGAACTTTNGTTIGGTASAFAAACGGTTADDDVWYRFTATSTLHTVDVVGGSITDPVIEWYAAGTCPAVAGTCVNTGTTNETVTLSTTIGTVYYVRVYSAGNATGQGTFTICVSTPPANDICTAATVLTPAAVGAACVNTNGTTAGATASAFAASCGAATADDDVWYRFTATSTTHIVTVAAVGMTNPAIEWYDAGVAGTCPSTGGTCVNAGATTESVTINTTIGNIYYVRVYSVGNATGQGTFTICVTTLPINDNCSTATVLTPAAAGAACVNTNGTTAGATASAFAASCGAATADDDVWYRFTATSTTHIVDVAAVGMTNPAMEWYDAGVAGTCPSVGGTCVNAGATSETVTISTTVGNIYYVRVYSVGNATGQGTFTICVTTPTNNLCAAATVLTPNSTCVTTNGTTVGATASAFAASCGAATADDDVWYRFTATAPSHTVTVTAGTMTNPAIEWYNAGVAGSCPSAGGTCVNAGATTETVTISTTVGNVYYVRVYSVGNATGQGTFTICVVTPPPPNDNCANAIALTSTGTCSNTSSYTISATNSGVATSCSGTFDDDVWFSFVAEVSNHTVTVAPTSPSGLDDATIEVLTGACGSLTSVACRNSTTGSSTESITLTGLLAGATYYVRVASAANGSGQGNFNICITHNPPANDNCANATVLTVGAFCTQGTIIAATNTAPNGSATCGNGARTVWYSFNATASSQVVFLDNFSGADLAFEVYSGTCGGTLTSLACVNTGGATVDERQVITGLTVGTTYLIRVNGNSATDRGDFCIQVYSVVPPNDDCTNATPLTVDVTCTNGSIDNATNTGVNGGAGCGASNTRTVWYSFVATQSSHYINLKQEDGGDLVFTVFSGTCAGGLTSLGCVDNRGAGQGEAGTATGLTVGATYLIRVSNLGAADIGNFCIKVHGTPPNDNCTNAVNLTVDAVCTNGHNFLATNTGTNPALSGSCTQNNTASVWYTFTATATSQIIELDPETGTGDVGLVLFNSSNQSCSGTFTELSCAENAGTSSTNGRETIVATGLTVGRRYYVMVTGQTSTSYASFCIRVKSPPTNNACANAINLTPGNNCVEGTTHSATSDGLPTTCIADDNSVWYTFTATQTSHTVRLTNGDPSVMGGADIAFRVFTGTCGALTQIQCVNNAGGGLNEAATFATTVGTTYRVMVDFVGTSATGNFCIAVLNPPINDAICSATSLNTDYSCQTGTLLGATNTGDPAIACGNNARTVWYSFVATFTTHTVAFTNSSTGTNTDLVLNVFGSSNGACNGTLTSLACVDNQTTGSGENVTLSGLTVGTTYFVAVAGKTANDIAEFCISVTRDSDLCSMAVPLATNATCVASGNISSSTTAATDGTCQVPQRTKWFSFTAAFSTAIINITPSADFDAEFTVFSSTAPCTGLTQLACIDGFGNGVAETTTLTGLTPGANYYVMVDGEASDVGTFCINVNVPIVCGTNPPPADDCMSAPLINNIDGYCGVTDYSYKRDLYNNMRDLMCTDVGTEIENNGFIKFVAASTSVTIELQIVNSSPIGGPPCDAGIQMNIFEVAGTDCRTAIWKPVTTCINPSGGAGSVVSRTATNLIPGNTYYVMFDGVSGDECGFLIRAPQGGGVLLPVVLINFTAQKAGNYHLLNWATSDEKGASHFTVEKSWNGVDFEEVTTVPAKGLSSKLVQYEAKNYKIAGKTIYYRLKIVDIDKTVTYSKVINIMGEDAAQSIDLNLYPNPAENLLNCQLLAPEDVNGLVVITNMLGHTILTKSIALTKGNNTWQENLSQLSSGIYILHLTDSNGNTVKKRFVKQ